MRKYIIPILIFLLAMGCSSKKEIKSIINRNHNEIKAYDKDIIQVINTNSKYSKSSDALIHNISTKNTLQALDLHNHEDDIIHELYMHSKILEIKCNQCNNVVKVHKVKNVSRNGESIIVTDDKNHVLWGVIKSKR